MAPTQTTIRCSACGQPFPATLRTYLDAQQDPQGKMLLLTGGLNNAQCPHCRTLNTIAAPVLYHDPTKELLVAYVPMELNLTKDQQEKAIGDLMRMLPKENFKGYMFAPKRTLTLQGLVEMVLQADGVTPEMMQEQRARVLLAQQLVEADETDLPALVQANDEKIDERFFQAMTLMAQRALEAGHQDVAEHILFVQGSAAEHSTYGKELLRQQEAQEGIVEEVAAILQQMGEDATRADFLKLARQYASSDQHLQALVGLARPAFDYTFFQEMSIAIGQAPAAERDGLEQLRTRLVELGELIDAQTQATVQNAVRFLQALVNDPNPDEMLQQNIDMVDDTFMAVLTSNIQEAERRGDSMTGNRLKQIYARVVAMIQQTMPPELRFINALLSAQSDQAAQSLLSQNRSQFGPELLEVMDAVEQALIAQNNTALLKRLALLRDDFARAL